MPSGAYVGCQHCKRYLKVLCHRLDLKTGLLMEVVLPFTSSSFRILSKDSILCQGIFQRRFLSRLLDQPSFFSVCVGAVSLWSSLRQVVRVSWGERAPSQVQRTLLSIPAWHRVPHRSCQPTHLAVFLGELNNWRQVERYHHVGQTDRQDAHGQSQSWSQAVDQQKP